MGIIIFFLIQSFLIQGNNAPIVEHTVTSNLTFLSEVQKQYWTTDSLGCNGNRSQLLPTVKDAIKSASRADVLENLGKPNFASDEQELFYYLVSSDCGDRVRPSNEIFFVITFNPDGTFNQFAINTVGG